MTEIWKPSPIFGDAYDVSSFGRVRSALGIKSAHNDKDGYPTVNLHKSGKRKACNVHRLVCRAFNGEPNILHTQVAHNDGDRQNGAASNLRWVSKTENEHDKRAHGRTLAGERHHNCKLTEQQARQIKQRLERGERQSALGREFGVSSHAVRDIARGKNWRHLASVHDGPVA